MKTKVRELTVRKRILNAEPLLAIRFPLAICFLTNLESDAGISFAEGLLLLSVEADKCTVKT